MHTQRRRRLLIALCLLTIAGCADPGRPGASRPLATTSAPQQVRYHDDVLTFSRPASWTPRSYEVVSSFSSAIVYLSNQPLHDPCTRRQLPGGGLVEWTGEGFPNWKLSDAPGAE